MYVHIEQGPYYIEQGPYYNSISAASEPARHILKHTMSITQAEAAWEKIVKTFLFLSL